VSCRSHDRAFARDPHAILAAARMHGPVVRVRGSREWLVLRRADVASLANDPRLALRDDPGDHPGSTDPGDPYGFAPSYLERVRVATRREARRLVDRAIDERQLDAVAFAEALASMLADDDRARTGRAATRALISTAILLLAGHPTELAALRADPLLLHRAIEEVTRFRPVVPCLRRIAREDVALGPFRIRAGDLVGLSVASANRDSDPLLEPERFDVRRRAAPHLSFGSPPRTCPGAGLARVITQEALGAWLTRCERVRTMLPGPPTNGR
jgi:cytochrome P450